MLQTRFVQRLCGLYPFYRGIDKAYKILTYLINCETWSGLKEIVIPKYGIIMKLDIGNPGQRPYFLLGRQYIEEFARTPLYNVIQQIFSAGCWFIDIGANIGIYSLLAGKIGWKCLAFEPEPTAFLCLKRNLSLNGNGITFRCENIALSNFIGTAEFHVGKYENNYGGSSLVDSTKSKADSGYAYTINMLVDRFDNIIIKLINDPSKIRLIKIDVEGNEFQTVQGMKAFFQEVTPDIWCEVRGPSSDRNPNSYYKVIDYLSDYNYKAYVKTSAGIIQFSEWQKKSNLPQVFDLWFRIS